jgi:hypothetical protein
MATVLKSVLVQRCAGTMFALVEVGRFVARAEKQG